MTHRSSTPVRLLARLARVLVIRFTLFLAGMAVVLAFVAIAAIQSKASTCARLHLTHARAGVLAASGGETPRAEAVGGMRQRFASLDPRIVLRVFDHGVPVGDALPLDALDSAGLSQLRAGGQAPLRLRDTAYPGLGGFRFYEPLASNPEVVISLRFPVEVEKDESIWLIWLVLVAVSALLLVLGVDLYAVLRRPMRRITRLSTAIDGMASSGDFTVEIPVDQEGDEITDLYAGVYGLVSLLRAVADALGEACLKLTAAGNSLTGTVEEQSAVLRNHSHAVDAASSSADELRSASETTTRRAEEVLAAAARAGELGAIGEGAVQDTQAALSEIRGEVLAMAERIAMVAERARQISGITQSVKEIADSTSMLALNAAIEAVRSGEQGKGFALLAREMRSLSDQSTRATERVREILRDVSVAIQEASANSSRGTQRIEAGLGQVTRSGESMRELARALSASSRSVQEIASAVRQQNAGIVQIVRSLTDQHAASQRAAESLSLTQVQAEDLKLLTGQVSELLKSYRF